MRNSTLDKQTLDAIGRQLVKSDAGRKPDVEAIVSKPYLFASVKARIAAGDFTQQHASAGFLFGSFIRLHMAGAAASAVLLLLAIGAFSLLETGRGVVAVDQVQIPPVREDVARPVFPPQGTETGKLSAGRALNDDFRVESAVAYKSTLPRPVRRPRRVEIETEGDFYPVGYTGDPNETAGGHVIRVEIKRSSLFALGVNLPLENDDEVLTAELLVGRDGVTRAVRVVR